MDVVETNFREEQTNGQITEHFPTTWKHANIRKVGLASRVKPYVRQRNSNYSLVEQNCLDDLPQSIPLQWFVHTGLRLVLSKEPRSIRDVHQYKQTAERPKESIDPGRQRPNVQELGIVTNRVQQGVPTILEEKSIQGGVAR